MKQAALLLLALAAPIAAFAEKYGVQEAIREGPPPDSDFWWLAVVIPGAILAYCLFSSKN